MSGCSVIVTSGKKPKKHRFHPFRTFLRILRWAVFLSVVLAVVAVVCLAYRLEPVVEGYWKDAIKLVSESSPEDFKKQETSYIYDADGKQMAKLRLDKDVNYVKYGDIPRTVVDAVIAIEDRRFWGHSGVDWLSTAKAGILYLRDSERITRGGSTITQQLAKNMYLSFEKSIERKCKEICIALLLEERYSKEQILEFYINNISYANGYYGIASAAKGYFNKSLDSLSLEEVAFLCAIPNNPSLYDPLRHIKNTTKRRNVILSEMWGQGYISQMEYLAASNSPIHFCKRKRKDYNYETSYSIDCAVKVLMRKAGFKEKYRFRGRKAYRKYLREYDEAYHEAKVLLYSGGFRVYTSIQPAVQKKVQGVLGSALAGFKEKGKDGVYRLQGACTVIDNATGNVIAIVGGRKQDFDGIITLNRAYQSYRQPGSAFKPLAVYTPGFESGYAPGSVVLDEPVANGPSNSDGGYEGAITLRHAVEKSKNVVAWRLMNSLGVKRCLSYVQSMQFRKIVPSDYYLSSSLGGLTYGVTTVEMASGYCTLANDGVFREPTCITKMTMSDGSGFGVSRDTHRVYSEDAARTMTDVLQGVAKVGTASRLEMDRGMPIACKTGTTNNQTNGWFCAYTPYYSTACYVGYDEARSVSNLWGATYPLEISGKVQNYLCKGKKVIAFKKVAKVKRENVATPSPSREPLDVSMPTETERPAYPKDTSVPTVRVSATRSPKPTKDVVEEETVPPEEETEPTDVPDTSPLELPSEPSEVPQTTPPEEPPEGDLDVPPSEVPEEPPEEPSEEPSVGTGEDIY